MSTGGGYLVIALFPFTNRVDDYTQTDWDTDPTPDHPMWLSKSTEPNSSCIGLSIHEKGEDPAQ